MTVASHEQAPSRAQVRTRFAPSPTGSLHVGNARIAVLDWLFARKHGGRFVLRIEDTDIERHDPASEAGIFADLAWLGLDWDEGPSTDGGPDRGEFGPYRQSQRRAIHHDFAERLREAGFTYECFCTATQDAEADDAAADASGSEASTDPTPRSETSRRGPRRDCECASLAASEIARLHDEGRPAALRFRVPRDREIVVRDIVRGDIRFDAREIADFVILRADGRPTYNFAVVADDIAMRITHVIRGAGHLSNTPRQILLFDALGAEPPVFVHVPTVLGPDRQKLSKRHGARALGDYRADGYHADAVVNYLSLLSWSSPSGDEVLDRETLIDEISLDRIGAADVVFDPVKLSWLSARHIERMTLDALVREVEPFARRVGWLQPEGPLAPDLLPEAVDAVRTHLSAFADIAVALAPLFPASEAPAGVAGGDGSDSASAATEAPRHARDDRGGPRDAPAHEPDRDARSAAVLGAALQCLDEVQDWTADALADAIKRAGKEAAARGRALYEPLRLALTGRPHGPPLVAILRVQGRARALASLASGLASQPGAAQTSSDT